MKIYLGRRAVRQIRDAARDAMDDGTTEALREEILDAFAVEDVAAIEELLDGEDLYDVVNAMLDDWGGDDLDELFELLESSLAELNVELTTEYAGDVDDTEVLEDEDRFPISSTYGVDDDDDGDGDGDGDDLVDGEQP